MYDELVKMLRVCGDSNNSCGNCPVRENDGCCPHGEWEFAAEKYMLQAADAIEELSSQLDDFKRLCLPLKENRLYKYSDGSFVEVFLILPSEPPEEET